MTVYYRGPTAHITDDLLEVWSPEHRAYRLSELRGVYVVSGTPVRRAPAPMLLPVVTVLAAIALPVVHAPVGLLVAALALAAASTVATALRRPAGRPYELHATHRGRAVRLFQCPDAQTFGQVRRGLLRALERRVGV